MKKRIAICLRGGISKIKTWFNKDNYELTFLVIHMSHMKAVIFQ